MNKISTPTQVYEVDGEILLRTAQVFDAELISQYFCTNKAFLQPWEPKREDAFYTIAGWSKKLIKLNELHKLGIGFYLLIIDRNTQEMLGTISFSNLSRFPMYSCTVGYSVAEHAQGKGIMSRALPMAVNYMFSIQNMHRIGAGYLPCNERSAAVLKKLGFKKEGYAEEYLLINGKWQDHVLTALTNPNWKNEKR
ncbi:ribosomal protein S5-alanine N-acetyltransferase [Vibrio marisflavi]|uniref:[Ribosomal protein S5]-alanine N-acetyltransferase n=1 Tax=Vibrio marisflavi CECT 7928 TaxID=634439 RepID=A0ABN8E5R8_9VIBR|nr:ribosomal protein S5-alanine N-acetyltransferase [Vibrio marisflavi]CAH0539589.1 [Ribosomal protein S5]-alanine N-acetyltransferase [Vibrio marisflavi CECT 7928]